MAYLTKEEYERRNKNAAKKMAANKEIAQGRLSDEQCELLEQLCKLRHEIHCLGASELFNSESNKSDTMNEIDGEHLIYEVKKSFPQASIIQDIEISEIPSDMDWYEGLIDQEEYEEDFENYRQESLEYLTNILHRWNEQVEEFLGIIDEEFGTSYRPTGWQRLF